MVEMVGEVADGFFVHPFHSRAFLDAETLPALARGLERGGRARKDLILSCQTIVALGSSDAEIEAARQKARGQISFYGSTPAYKGVLEHHGYPDLQPELNRLSKQGQWPRMIGLIDDALFDQIAVSGTPSEVAAKLRTRNRFADRSTLMLYNETHPEAVVDVVRELARLVIRALSRPHATGRKSRGEDCDAATCDRHARAGGLARPRRLPRRGRRREGREEARRGGRQADPPERGAAREARPQDGRGVRRREKRSRPRARMIKRNGTSRRRPQARLDARWQAWQLPGAP
jgi:hypothetical protein